jgi:hypothetical protein
MLEEMAVLEKNEAWDMMELSTRINSISNKWVFKKKFNVEGKVEKYKSCLVQKGYSLVEGIKFGEFFSLVVKPT